MQLPSILTTYIGLQGHPVPHGPQEGHPRQLRPDLVLELESTRSTDPNLKWGVLRTS